MTNLPSDFYCCDYSTQVGEQLFATATRVDVWLALEYTLPWGKDAFAESLVLDSVKQRMDAYLAAIPRSRLQLIRQPERRSSGVFAFYVAVSGEERPALYRMYLDSYEALLTLDVPAIVSGDPVYERFLSDEPIFLVCANGKRDISCAKFGRPVYEAMSAIAGEAVWQCTHIGGHRFAATSVFLPHGVCYGRIAEGDAESLMDEFRQGQIHLETYRGRAYYDEAVQAADYFLRQQSGARGLFEFRLMSAEQSGDDWAVAFQSASDGLTYVVYLSQFLSDFPIIKNSSDAQGAPGVQFRLMEIEGQ